MSQPPIPEVPVARTLEYGPPVPRQRRLWLGVLSAIALAVGFGFFVTGVGYMMRLPTDAPEVIGFGSGCLVFGGICMWLYWTSNAHPRY